MSEVAASSIPGGPQSRRAAMRAAIGAAIRARLPLYRGPLVLAFSLFGIVLTVGLFAMGLAARGTPVGFDAHAYWAADPLHPYGAPLGSYGAYTYSPAFAQLLAPVRLLPFEVFYALWAAALGVVLVWLCRRYTLLWLALLPLPVELYEGNVHILLAAVCVLGFRYPAVWSFALLTKLTPGVGLLWFLVRREWRSLALALGATVVVAAVSFAIAPSAWPDWGRYLADSSAAGPGINNKVYLALIPPLWLRLGAAALIVVWGARTDRRWTVPVAATLALPVLWLSGPAILAAIPRLRAGAARGPAADPEAAAPEPAAPGLDADLEPDAVGSAAKPQPLPSP